MGYFAPLVLLALTAFGASRAQSQPADTLPPVPDSRPGAPAGGDGVAPLLTPPAQSETAHRLLGADGSVAWLPPGATSVWNSALPYSAGQDRFWAGRGLSGLVRAGLAARWGGVRLVMAPEWTAHQNRDFQILPARLAGRSAFAAPWPLEASIDLPQRFGDGGDARFGWGESSLSAARGGVEGGVSSERQWWGPGRRTSIVLGSSGPGFPHLFLRTTRPVQSPVGRVEATWLLGGLSESDYFDADPGNDSRALNGVVFTLAPDWEPDLSLGVARVVYSTVDGRGETLARGLDFALVGNAGRSDRRAWDQITSLFFRWALPPSGFEAYGEWARSALPTSPRDLLLHPGGSQGYTLGAMWNPSLGASLALRVNPEITYLEQSGDFTQGDQPTFYRSRTVPQGYTHRGRSLGAEMGPGSSQWISGDLVGQGWEVGLLAGRIRWNNDAYYEAFVPRLHQIGFVSHDVSLLRGIRAQRRFGWGILEAEFIDAERYDYLFQNRSLGFNTTDAVDVPNRTLRLQLSPFWISAR